MKKDIYIHIGIGKTGTSAIQKTLLNKRQELMEQGIYVPHTGLNDDKLGHHRLANYLEDVPSDKTIKIYEELFKELRTVSQSNILISSELYCYSKPQFIDFLQTTFSEYNIKIIFFVREQVSLIESAYLWWQSQGYDYRYNIKDFFEMAKGGFNYIWMINKWAERFGDENITVKVYDKNIYKDGIIKYFFDEIDNNIELPEQNEKINKSLLPCYSKLISFMDILFPELLDKQTKYFMIRKNIIAILISISDINTIDILDKINKIKNLLNDSLDGFSQKEAEFDKFITEFIQTLNLNYRLIDDVFRKEILEYYHQSNQQFANRFLEGNKKIYFMKNYQESSISDE